MEKSQKKKKKINDIKHQNENLAVEQNCLLSLEPWSGGSNLGVIKGSGN